jgi:hypothetical protein
MQVQKVKLMQVKKAKLMLLKEISNLLYMRPFRASQILNKKPKVMPWVFLL